MRGIDQRLGLSHDLGVLARRVARVVEGEALLDLIAQLLAVQVGGRVEERVETRGDRALVGEVARDAALVLGGRATDKGRVEDQTVLGRAASRLEGTVERERVSSSSMKTRARASVRERTGREPSRHPGSVQWKREPWQGLSSYRRGR